MKKYKIVCVLPNFNGEKNIENTIKSFLAQNIKNKKMIIIDRKSNDQSHKIIKKYLKNKCIIWSKYKDTGLCDAHNKGLEYLTFQENEIYLIIGNDDVLEKNIFRNVLKNFSKYLDAGALYYDQKIKFMKNGKLMKEYKKCSSKEINLKILKICGNIVGTQNLFIKAKYLKKFKYLNSHKYANDYFLYLYLAQIKKFKFKYIPKAACLSYNINNISTKYVFEGALESVKIYYKVLGLDLIFLYRLLLLIRVKVVILFKKIIKYKN